MVDFAVVPDRTALISVDMQNYFVQNAPDGLVVLDHINRLAAVCRDVGSLVVHVRFVLRPDSSNAGIMGKIYPFLKHGAFSPDAEGAAWHTDLVIKPCDVLIEKPRFGAFHATDLELLLRSRGIDTVLITGIQTDVCCDTTAREAMQREFHVHFLSDATATSNKGDLTAAELQKVTLRTMLNFAQVLTVNELIAKLRGAAGAGSRAA